MGHLVDQAMQHFHLLRSQQCESEDHGEEEHLKDLTIYEGADHGVGDNSHDKVQRGMLLCFFLVLFHCCFIWFRMQTSSWLHHFCHQQPDHQGQG